MSYPGSSNPLTIIVLAVLLLGATLTAKFWLLNQAKVISEELVMAEVLSLEEKQLSYSDKIGGTITNNIGIAQLQFEDGKTFTSTVPQPYPSIGENVPVKVVHYSDGSANATVVAPGY